MPVLTFAVLAEPTAAAVSLLAQAEALYGPRDPDWTFSGVTEVNGGPMILYPDHNVAMIGISPGSVTYADQLLFQIAHEVIHLLSPDRYKGDASMIEEGLAVKFSLDGPDYPGPGYRTTALHYIENNAASANYRDALHLLMDLEKLHPDAIKRLRAVEPRIHAWTPELLIEQLCVTAEMATRLCEKRGMRPRQPFAVQSTGS